MRMVGTRPMTSGLSVKCRMYTGLITVVEMKLIPNQKLVTPILVPREGGNWFRYASLHHLFEARTLTDLWAVGEFV